MYKAHEGGFYKMMVSIGKVSDRRLSFYSLADSVALGIVEDFEIPEIGFRRVICRTIIDSFENEDAAWRFIGAK